MSTSRLLDALYLVGLAAVGPYEVARVLTGRLPPEQAAQRWGRLHLPDLGGRRLWLHCSSVGEVLLTRKLVGRLETALPRYRTVLSISTQTGYNAALRVFEGRPVFRHPVDLSWVVRGILEEVRPRALLLMEREVWPQLVLAASTQRVPVALLNARRFSERSVRWYRRLGRIAERTFQSVSLYLVQGERDASFFRTLGISAECVRVVGNLKYDNVSIGVDHETANGLRGKLPWPTHCPVWVAGSTHEGEEGVLLESFRLIRREHPDLRLVLVPRYPHRASRVQALVSAHGLACERWSRITEKPGTGGQQAVLIVDTLGELSTFYQVATVVFVGGSLIPHGGHNVIEPVAVGCPTLVGPHHENNREAVEFLTECGALRVVSDCSEITGAVSRFIREPEARQAAGSSGQQAIRQRQGACERHVQELVAWLSGFPCKEES